MKTVHALQPFRLPVLLSLFVELTVPGTLEAAGGTGGTKDVGVKTTIQNTFLDIWSAFIAHIPYIVAGLFFLFLTWIASVVVSKLLTRVLKKMSLRSSLQQLAERFCIVAVWALGILLSAMVVFPGLTPSKALGAMGIASIAVGFAFKDIFENFFAGILLLWRFPFERGDFIQCQDVTGKVEDIQVRMTQIREPSGELVVVPNSTLFKNPVTVLTSQDTRRVSIVTGVAYGEEVSEAVGVIEEAVQGCSSVDTTRDIQVFPRAFGSSSIDIEVAWWTGSTPLDVRRSRGEIVTAVKAALDRAGIEIPFPYRTLTFKEVLEHRTIE
jgi:small-conductance mechanosensitive channel